MLIKKYPCSITSLSKHRLYNISTSATCKHIIQFAAPYIIQSHLTAYILLYYEALTPRPALIIVKLCLTLVHKALTLYM